MTIVNCLRFLHVAEGQRSNSVFFYLSLINNLDNIKINMIVAETCLSEVKNQKRNCKLFLERKYFTPENSDILLVGLRLLIQSV